MIGFVEISNALSKGDVEQFRNWMSVSHTSSVIRENYRAVIVAAAAYDQYEAMEIVRILFNDLSIRHKLVIDDTDALECKEPISTFRAYTSRIKKSKEPVLVNMVNDSLLNAAIFFNDVKMLEALLMFKGIASQKNLIFRLYAFFNRAVQLGHKEVAMCLIKFDEVEEDFLKDVSYIQQSFNAKQIELIRELLYHKFALPRLPFLTPVRSNNEEPARKRLKM